MLDSTVDRLDANQYGGFRGISTTHARVDMVHTWFLAARKEKLHTWYSKGYDGNSSTKMRTLFEFPKSEILSKTISENLNCTERK